MSKKLDHVLSVKEMGITLITSPTTSKPVELTGDVDDAMEFAIHNAEEHFSWDQAEENKLIWKIDLYLMPLICILYAFQFMDKLTNGYAAVLGLETDLHMEGQMYSWTGSAFYLGYLFWEMPAALSVQRFPVATTVSVYIVLWGSVLALHAACLNYAEFVALRTLLGVLESSVTPAFVVITAQWYKKEEVFLRTAIWYAFNGFGGIIGPGVIAYYLYENQDSYLITPWKVVFIVTGVLTVFLGICIFFHVPNKPTLAWFLNDREKQIVVERIRKNQQGFGNKHFKWYQFKEAMTDPVTGLFFIIAVTSSIPNGGITTFGSILLKSQLGYSTAKTLRMDMLPGVVQWVGCISLAYLYRFYPVRMLWAVVGYGLAFVATCMLAYGTTSNVQMAGFALIALLAMAFTCVLACVASNVAGHTKKITSNAVYLIGYCVGNMIGPQTFRSDQAPVYGDAKIAMVVSSGVCLALMGVLWWYLWKENKKRDAIPKEELVEFEMLENHEFADLTDKQNPLFRYTL